MRVIVTRPERDARLWVQDLQQHGLNAEALWVTPVVALPSFILMIGITLLELLVCAIQAYVFALLTSLYINDAVNLH